MLWTLIKTWNFTQTFTRLRALVSTWSWYTQKKVINLITFSLHWERKRKCWKPIIHDYIRSPTHPHGVLRGFSIVRTELYRYSVGGCSALEALSLCPSCKPGHLMIFLSLFMTLWPLQYLSYHEPKVLGAPCGEGGALLLWEQLSLDIPGNYSSIPHRSKQIAPYHLSLFCSCGLPKLTALGSMGQGMLGW